MHFHENVLLAPYTTFKIGGPARWFADVSSEQELLDAVHFAGERKLPLFVLGGGSNLLVADEGFPGLVVHIANKGIEQHGDTFRVAAGEDWDHFVSHVVERNYAGLECMAGIPGTVGGTPVQNVGAYGQEVAETITSVRALDLKTMAFEELPPSACAFAYRQSIFNTAERGRYIVTRVNYTLDKDGAPRIAYADLKNYFSGTESPSLAQVSTAVRAIRKQKGMLLVPGDPDCRSAGSFFKNPIVSADHYAGIAGRYTREIPHYPAPGGQIKLAAAWLVDQAGFHKGYRLGAAGISSRHTLALVNKGEAGRGEAKAADILALRDKIVAEVHARFGILLEPEPVFLR